MHALQDLGEALVALDPKRLARELDLPERLVDAIAQARGITAGAAARQIQYIGKLMRDIDPAPDPATRSTRWAHGPRRRARALRRRSSTGATGCSPSRRRSTRSSAAHPAALDRPRFAR